MRILKRFVSYYKPYRFLFWFDMVCALVLSAIDLAFHAARRRNPAMDFLDRRRNACFVPDPFWLPVFYYYLGTHYGSPNGKQHASGSV